MTGHHLKANFVTYKHKKQMQTEATQTQELTAESFVKDGATVNTIDSTDSKGNPVKHVLLKSGKIATVREGKGKDVEKATIESAGDQSKYLSSMMAACIRVEGEPLTMYGLSDMPMKDYTTLQAAFAELNF